MPPKRKTKRSPRKGKGRRKGSKITTGGSRQRTMPDRMRVKLSFNKLIRMNHAGFASIGTRFQWNSAYDIDPTVGSAAIPGYAEYSALYSYYRVMSTRATVRMVNYEGFDVFANLRLTNTDPGTSSSNAVIDASLPHAKKALLKPCGFTTGVAMPNEKTLSIGISASRLLGDRAARTDAEYRAITAGNPTDLLWVGLMLETGTGSLFANGVEVLWTIEIMVEFTSFIEVLTAFKAPVCDLVTFEKDRIFNNISRCLINSLRESNYLYRNDKFAKEYSDPTELFLQVWQQHVGSTQSKKNRYS